MVKEAKSYYVVNSIMQCSGQGLSVTYLKKSEMGSREAQVDSRFLNYPCKETSGVLYTDLFKKSLRPLFDTGKASMLDIGCGYGWVSEELAKKGFSMTAIDINWSLCRFANRRFKTKSLDVMVVCCDAESLPFRNEAFDEAAYNATLHHMPKPLASLKEVSRVARSFFIINEPRQPKYINNVILFLSRVFGKFKRFNAVAGQKYDSVMDQGMLRIDTDALSMFLEKNGYSVVNRGYWSFVPPFLQNVDNVLLVSLWKGTLGILNTVFFDLSNTFYLKAAKTRQII